MLDRSRLNGERAVLQKLGTDTLEMKASPLVVFEEMNGEPVFKMLRLTFAVEAVKPHLLDHGWQHHPNL